MCSMDITVTGIAGWRYTFTSPLPRCPSLCYDDCYYLARSLHYKYDIVQYVHDNWFVLTAILRDQYGLNMVDCACARHCHSLHRECRKRLDVCFCEI